MGIELQTQEFYALSGGMNDHSADTALNDSEWSFLRNAEFSRDGSISTRLGQLRDNSTQINGGAAFLLDFYYQLDNGSSDRLIVVGDALYRYNSGTPILIQNGFSITNYWSAAQLSNRVILGNGIDGNRKWNGSNLYNLSIVAPVDIGLTATVGAGGTLPVGTYQYRYTYRNSTTLDESNPVNATASATTVLGNQTITLTNFAVSPDPQVDQIVIYRTTTNGVTFFEIATKANTNVAFVDSGIVDGTFELQEDNDIAPTSGILASFLGRLYLADNDFLYYSKPFFPGQVPSDNLFRVGRDGQPITCLLSIGNNALLIGKKRSIWILTNDPATGSTPVNFNNLHGILNNRCASILDDNVLFIDQSIRPYILSPTDLANSERRIPYIGNRMANTFAAVSASGLEHIKCQTVSIEDRRQWLVSVPLESTFNSDSMIVLDLDVPSMVEGEIGAWTVWTGVPAGTLTIAPDGSGIPRFWRGDYNGFMWRMFITHGDGASVNGTITSATINTLTDSTQSWGVNQFIGMPVFLPSGLGANQRRTVVSNTATTLTITPNWTTIPDSTTTYAIGGIDFRAYTNWKNLSNHEIIKRLWFLWVNLSQIGTYTIYVDLQFDFNTGVFNTLSLTLTPTNSIWGIFLWGVGIWGGNSSFQEKIQFDQYFHHMRIGYRNAFAGQPISLNGMGISFQAKGLFTA